MAHRSSSPPGTLVLRQKTLGCFELIKQALASCGSDLSFAWEPSYWFGISSLRQRYCFSWSPNNNQSFDNRLKEEPRVGTQFTKVWGTYFIPPEFFSKSFVFELNLNCFAALLDLLRVKEGLRQKLFGVLLWTLPRKMLKSLIINTLDFLLQSFYKQQFL